MLLIGGFGLQHVQRNWLETGFMALLPTTEQRPGVGKAIQQQTQAFNRKVVWLVGAASAQQAIVLAKQLQQPLHDSGLFAQLQLQIPLQDYQQRYQKLFDYRYHLLDEHTRQLLLSNPQQISQDNLQQLYGPMGQLQAANLERDPLLLFARYFQAQNPSQLNLEQGIVILQEGERHWALLLSELQDNDLKLDKLAVLRDLTATTEQLITNQGGALLVSGLPLFTAHGAHTAQQEISTIGVGSSIGVVLLLFLTFRSPRPLLLCGLAVASGLLAAWLLCLVLFGKIHMLTLVFGSSLIGVVVDYALHFFCDGMGLPHWTPREGLRFVLPGLAFGLLTSLLGYAGLGFSPFPGLQQIAVFSAIGLVVAWLTVVLLFPFLLQGFQLSHQAGMFGLTRYWQQHWPHWLFRHRYSAVCILAVLIGGGFWQLQAKDDVRLLQTPPPTLVASDAKIKQLLPFGRDNQFFVVTGNSQAEWYANEQRLTTELAKLQRQRQLKSHTAISNFWPDTARQQENYQLLKNTVYAAGYLPQYMAELGFSAAAITQELAHFQAAEKQSLPLSDWLNTADESKRLLWLDDEHQAFQSIVTLNGVHDVQALAQLAMLPGVSWVDSAGQMSELFQRYRLRVSVLLLGICGLILALLVVKLGWRQGLQVMAVPILAMLSALAVLGWLQELFTLFNVFALLLVLEVSLDYAVFFQMAKNQADAMDKRNSTSLAVTLSALTTLLAYGLLATSSTAIVHAFGITLAVGVFSAFLLAPMIGFSDLAEK